MNITSIYKSAHTSDTPQGAQSALVPMVIKKSFDGERSMDLFSLLLQERIIIISEPVTPELSNTVIAQLLYLQSQDSKKDITMYINTPGGSVVDKWAIIDAMDLVTNDIVTICTGMAASAGSSILANGTKGKRMILEHAEVMIHQPSGGAQGQATDIQIQADQIQKGKELTTNFLAEKTGQSLKQVAADLDRDYYMNAEESLAYGIVDKILTKS